MQHYESHLAEWKAQQELAEQMLPRIGRLYRDRGVVLRVYGRPVVNCSTLDIIKAHRYVRHYENEPLAVEDSYRVLEAMSELPLEPVRIDLGRLTVNFLREGGPLGAYLRRELAPALGGGPGPANQPQDVVLYGFGRIGRLLARLLIERTGSGQKLRLRAVVVRKGHDGDLAKRASLLRRDSVHGPFNGTITVDEARNALIANGNFIQVIYAEAPDAVDYTAHGIDNALVVDNTGRWRDEEGLGRHLEAPGVAKVLLTAPGKGGIRNVVFGVNHGDIEPGDRIVSAASCTTNAITPVLKVIDDEFGIVDGHVETVHAYTNDQNLLDNYHRGERRGRSAALNMVLTETGAARAVAKALPQLAGKLTGSSIRVPVPDVSLAVLNLNLRHATDKEQLCAYLRHVSLHSELREQVDYTASTELVSSDLVGSRHAGVVDAGATIVDGRRCVLYVWYDNEFGYSAQVVRVMQEMAGLRYASLPA